MTLKEVGGIFQIEKFDESLLSPQWYSQLSEAQLLAYIRYQYIRFKYGVFDWDSKQHTARIAKWDGGKDQFGVKFKSVWGKALAAMHNFERDFVSAIPAYPGTWVAARFSGVAETIVCDAKSTAPPVRPTSLYDYHAAIIYNRYCERFNEMFAHSLRVGAQVIDTRLKEMAVYPLADDDRHFYVLCDEAYVSATPFLRHGIAAEIGCRRAALKYLWPAAIDYEAKQALYDTALVACNAGNFVSKDLRAKVVEIRKHWVNYRG